jgi:hypothetical protein
VTVVKCDFCEQEVQLLSGNCAILDDRGGDFGKMFWNKDIRCAGDSIVICRKCAEKLRSKPA